MFKHGLKDGFTRRNFFDWFLLAFLAGNVNAGGFLACGQFVTHVTGFSTLTGIEVATGSYDRGIGLLSVPLFFLLGVIISAWFVDRRHHSGLKPRYALVMGLVAFCLLLVALGGHYGHFGYFGEGIRLKQDYFLLALLCMASGLQNAAITTGSGATVRTTHLTGITTDLGIGIVRAFTVARSAHSESEVRSNYVRLSTIFAYTLGSAVGAFLFMRVDYLGFLLPMALAIYAMVMVQAAETARK